MKLRLRVAAAARAKFAATHSDPLLVVFHWNPTRYLSQSDVELFASSMAATVAGHIPQDQGGYVHVSFDELDGTPLDEYVLALHITRVKSEKQCFWSYADAGFSEVQANELEDLISFKDAKAAEYLQNCTRVWLLIVADGQRISSTADITQATLKNPFHSQFEQVLFYDRPAGNVIRLA